MNHSVDLVALKAQIYCPVYSIAIVQEVGYVIIELIVYLVQSQYKVPMSITPIIFVIGIWDNQ